MLKYFKESKRCQVHFLFVRFVKNSLLVIYWERAVLVLFLVLMPYRNDPKFSDRYTWANSADPDQTAPVQGPHRLPFRLHHLDSLLLVEPHSSNFRVITTTFLVVRIFRKFTAFAFLSCLMTWVGSGIRSYPIRSLPFHLLSYACSL